MWFQIYIIQIIALIRHNCSNARMCRSDVNRSSKLRIKNHDRYLKADWETCISTGFNMNNNNYYFVLLVSIAIDICINENKNNKKVHMHIENVNIIRWRDIVYNWTLSFPSTRIHARIQRIVLLQTSVFIFNI